MKRSNYYHTFLGIGLSFLYAQLSLALEVELKITCIDLPICTVPAGKIFLFTPEHARGVTAKGNFIADVKTTLEPHEEHLSGEVKVEYNWAAGGLNIIRAKESQCTVLVQSASEWGKLYPVACTVTVTAGNGTKVVKTEEDPTSTPSFEIEEIHFNHDPESCLEDAMNLNKEFQQQTVIAPEWTRAKKSDPFLYKGKSNPTIKAKVNLKPAELAFGEIRADQGAVNRAREKEKKGVLLGPLKSRYFFNNELTSFELTTPIRDELSHDYQVWDWKLLRAGDVNVEDKGIIVRQQTPTGYIVFSGATLEPWSEHDVRSYPWVHALDFVLDICKTKESLYSQKEEVMTKISQSIYNDHGRAYDKKEGLSHFTGGKPPEDSPPETVPKPYGWYLNDYLQRKENEQGIIVNCADQAYALNSLARLVGVGMQILQFEGSLPLQSTIRLVGLNDKYDTPFIMHRICTYGKDLTNPTVYDPTEGKISAQNIRTVIGPLPFTDYISQTLKSQEEGMYIQAGTVLFINVLPLK